MTNTNVFQRVEKKYRVDDATRATLEQQLAAHLCRNCSRDGLVTSLYLDTADHQLISRSMEKPLYKEKLRLRAYGRTSGSALMRAFAPHGARLDREEASQRVFLEMKMKLNGVGYKRRLPLPLGVARQFLDGAPLALALSAFPQLCGDEPPSQREAQIGRELAALLSRYGALEPSLAVRCQREAWGAASAQGDDVRITFDNALEYAVMGAPETIPSPMAQAQSENGSGAVADPCSAASWKPLLAPGESIMEAKACGAFPLWLTHALAEARVRPQSFSKCGTAARIAFFHSASAKGAPCA